MLTDACSVSMRQATRRWLCGKSGSSSLAHIGYVVRIIYTVKEKSQQLTGVERERAAREARSTLGNPLTTPFSEFAWMSVRA